MSWSTGVALVEVPVYFPYSVTVDQEVLWHIVPQRLGAAVIPAVSA